MRCYVRYIIIDQKEGVFLGTREHPSGDYGMLFSAKNFFEITKATAWDTKEAAEEYMNKYVKKWCPLSFVAEIDTNDDYADVVDIIKSGYGQHVKEMFDCLPVISESIH